MQITVIILFRLILYDEPVYEDVSGSVTAYGYIESIKERDKGITVTVYNVNVTEGPKVSKRDKLLVYYSSSDNLVNDLKIGQLLKITGEAKPFDTPSNPGEFNASGYYHNKGYSYSIFSEQIDIVNYKYNRIKEAIRTISDRVSAIYYKILPENEAGLTGGIVLGKRELISEEDEALYRKNGIMHLLAVSGMHVSTISMLILWIISHTGVGFVKGRTITAALLIIYGYLTGFSISCMRAVIMIIMSIAARICGRGYDSPQAISAAGIIILLFNPKDLFSAAFLLSFGAVSSITLLAPVYLRQLECVRLKPVISSLTVTLVTIPVIIYFYNDTSLYTFLLNLIVIPLMTLLFIAGVVSVILYVISPGLGEFAAGTIHYIFMLYEKMCLFCEEHIYSLRITGHISISRIMIYYILGIVICVFIMICRKCVINRIVYAVSILAGLIILSYSPKTNEALITMLDVGQGDGLLIEMPSGENMLIDGGSSDNDELAKYTLEPFLRYKGINHVDMWAVTHMDSDHTSGLIDLLSRARINRITIGTLILSDIADKSVYNELLSYSDVYENVIFMSRNQSLSFDDMLFTCLNPVKNSGGLDGANDYSLVFKMTYKEFDMLFTGDISESIEKELVNISDCDVLKVAHHGSKNSSSEEFLNIVSPKIAVISAGQRNTYGHPHLETIERLKECGAGILCTKDTGAIIISTDGHETRVGVKKRQSLF